MNSFIWKNPANAGGGGNISQLEQEVQQLQTKLQQIAAQIQNLTQQLTNVAKKNEENNFSVKQKITTPNKALTIVQDNNANYISFERSDGTRRGYVGMGSSGSNKIHLNGDDGIQISSTTGDLELNPAGSINANNKPILNVGVSNDPNAAISVTTIGGKIKHDLQLGVNIINGVATITLPTNAIAIFSYLIIDVGANDSPINYLVNNVSIRNNQVIFDFVGQVNKQAHFDIWYI